MTCTLWGVSVALHLEFLRDASLNHIANVLLSAGPSNETKSSSRTGKMSANDSVVTGVVEDGNFCIHVVFVQVTPQFVQKFN